MILLPTIENAFNGKDKEAEKIDLATDMMINEGKNLSSCQIRFQILFTSSVASGAQYQNERNRLLIEKWILGIKIQQREVQEINS